NARRDDRTMADPYIVADDYALRLTPCPKLSINAEITKILIRPIADLMRRQPLHRMLESIDANIRGNGTELADFGIDPLAVPLQIGEVTHIDFTKNHTLADIGISSQFHGFQLGRGMNARFAVLEMKIIRRRHCKFTSSFLQHSQLWNECLSRFLRTIFLAGKIILDNIRQNIVKLRNEDLMNLGAERGIETLEPLHTAERRCSRFDCLQFFRPSLFLDDIKISQFSRRANGAIVPQDLQTIGKSNRIELFDI